ncbi:hypothetical protein [Lacticaseibacillus porcinae]|uniref:hypothetical protein n=1 Tax=Lacticaseibacillus porcinae TaxID=1123687 RepID=UPI000F773C0F|nr:hypothetical protein [Lacticaseibacillus porcinae]
MNDAYEALAKPAIRFLSDNGLSALTGRVLFTTQLVIGKVSLPARGSFKHLIGAFSDGITVTVVGDQVMLDAPRKKQFTFTPTRIDVFLAQIKANEYSSWQTSPSYLTFLHMIGKDFDFYIRVSGGRAGKYLIDHPQQLPVHDILGLKNIETGHSEIDLAEAINAYGYSKLVEDTPVAFLNTDNIANGYRLASVTSH